MENNKNPSKFKMLIKRVIEVSFKIVLWSAIITSLAYCSWLAYEPLMTEKFDSEKWKMAAELEVGERYPSIEERGGIYHDLTWNQLKEGMSIKAVEIIGIDKAIQKGLGWTKSLITNVDDITIVKGKVIEKTENILHKDSAIDIESYLSRIQVVDQKHESLISSLTTLKSHKLKHVHDSKEINRFLAENTPYKKPPHDVMYPTYEILTTEKQSFARVYNPIHSSPTGHFLMFSEDIKGLTPTEIRAKYALDYTPTHIVDAEIPKGHNIYVSIAAPNCNQPGGGVQIQLKNRLTDSQKDSWFNNERKIKWK
jgi:hypothetical protein